VYDAVEIYCHELHKLNEDSVGYLSLGTYYISIVLEFE